MTAVTVAVAVAVAVYRVAQLLRDATRLLSGYSYLTRTRSYPSVPLPEDSADARHP